MVCANINNESGTQLNLGFIHRRQIDNRKLYKHLTYKGEKQNSYKKKIKCLKKDPKHYAFDSVDVKLTEFRSS